MFFKHQFAGKPQAAAGPRSWFEIKAAADDDTTEILIYDYIGWYGVEAGDFAAELEKVTTPKITLRINSPGGSVFDGFAIFNLLRDHPATVTSKVDGIAASIASLIALAGETVEIPKTAFMMIHNPWAFVIGNAADMRAMADTLDKVASPLVGVYSEKTGKKPDEIRELLDAETWYTGEEAVEAGLADVLIDTSSAAEGESETDAGENAAAAAAAFDPSLFSNPPAELAGDTSPAADAIELQRRRLRLMELE